MMSMLYPAGTPTQPEVIAVALSKLNIKPDDVFADIGCGSGSVSISAARVAKYVYAIDNRDAAADAAASNLKECGITNAIVIKGEASVLLSNLDIDCAFVGGSKNIEHVLSVLMKRVPRFVVSAVRMETVALVLRLMKNNNSFNELLQIQISRGSELAGGTMLKTENPVFLVAGGGSC